MLLHLLEGKKNNDLQKSQETRALVYSVRNSLLTRCHGLLQAEMGRKIFRGQEIAVSFKKKGRLQMRQSQASVKDLDLAVGNHVVG